MFDWIGHPAGRIATVVVFALISKACWILLATSIPSNHLGNIALHDLLAAAVVGIATGMIGFLSIAVLIPNQARPSEPKDIDAEANVLRTILASACTALAMPMLGVVDWSVRYNLPGGCITMSFVLGFIATLGGAIVGMLLLCGVATAFGPKT